MTEDTSPENLRKFLESDDPAMVRMGLSLAKGTESPEDYHQTLLQTLQRLLESHEPEMRRMGLAVTEASGIPEEFYKNVFGLSLWDPEEENRKAAGKLVEEIGMKNITKFPGWLEPFDEVVDEICESAVYALSEIGDTRAVEPLIEALYYDHSVCDAAARALGKIGDSRAVEPLIEALDWMDSGAWGNHTAAAWALGKIGDARAVEPLISMILERDNDKYIHEAAAWALKNMGEPAVEAIITDLEEDWSNHIRLVETGDKTYLIIENRGAFGNGDMISETILRVLWNIGEPAVEPLVNALTGTRGDVRVLGEFDDARTIEPFIQALEVAQKNFGDGIE